MTLYTLQLLDFQTRLFLCKYFIVQYGVGLPGAFKQYFCLFADYLGCTEVVRVYEPLSLFLLRIRIIVT